MAIHRIDPILLYVALAGAVLIAAPTEANACGGFFCDGGGAPPTPMPAPPPPSMRVDQTGEAILFAWGDGFVEAHIQIAYDGNDATQFAWIVPVQKVPEIEVGTARLFQAVLDSTRPEYGLDVSCGTDDSSDSGFASTVGFIQAPDHGLPHPGGGGGDPPPTVVVHDVVGAFDYVVLDGGTAETVNAWLGENGYASPEQAPAILDEYLDDGFLFVAFKLRHIAGVADIHPIVLRYPGDEPCVPLRLTRVAAVDDMPIRVFALADARAYPLNWRHVMLNRARLDWIDIAANYDELVIRAIDEPGSDGRGFVTEYSGQSSRVDRSVMTFADLDASAFEGIAVTDVYDALHAQRLATCGDSCDWAHELVEPLLHEFIPVPDDVAQGEFYRCLSCFVDRIDVAGWDPAAFRAAFEERIVAPLANAHALLDRWPVLTRLYTRVSPHEMLTDPTFALVPDAPTIPYAYWALTEGECCDTVRLPGMRRVRLAEDGSWPGWPEEMPWAERIEELVPGAAVPIELVNRSAEIDALVEQLDGPGSACGAAPPADSSGGDTSETTAAADAGGGGCGCRSGASNGGTALLAALACLRRRRRR